MGVNLRFCGLHVLYCQNRSHARWKGWLCLCHHPGVIVRAIKVEVIRRREQAVRSVSWKAREDDDKRAQTRKKGGMVRLLVIGGGIRCGRRCEARVCRARPAVGHDADLRGL